MTARVCVTWVEDFCPEVQTGTRGLRPCLTSTLFGPMLHKACCPRKSFYPSSTVLFACSRLYLWWRRTLAVALRLICPQICLACVRTPKENIACYWELLGDQWPGDGVTADNNLCRSIIYSIICKQILQYLYRSYVSSEDRSLNKLLWLWQSPEEL